MVDAGPRSTRGRTVVVPVAGLRRLGVRVVGALGTHSVTAAERWCEKGRTIRAITAWTARSTYGTQVGSTIRTRAPASQAATTSLSQCVFRYSVVRPTVEQTTAASTAAVRRYVNTDIAMTP
jgi:hypothetical protein